MPQMGESIVEGTVTKWLKKVGDKVERDEPLLEISTDKVDSEVPAPVAGTLEEMLVGEGETVEINSVLARIGDGSGAGQGQLHEATRNAEPSQASAAQASAAAAEAVPEPSTPPATADPAPATADDGDSVRSSPSYAGSPRSTLSTCGRSGALGKAGAFQRKMSRLLSKRRPGRGRPRRRRQDRWTLFRALPKRGSETIAPSR